MSKESWIKKAWKQETGTVDIGFVYIETQTIKWTSYFQVYADEVISKILPKVDNCDISGDEIIELRLHKIISSFKRKKLYSFLWFSNTVKVAQWWCKGQHYLINVEKVTDLKKNTKTKINCFQDLNKKGMN